MLVPALLGSACTGGSKPVTPPLPDGGLDTGGDELAGEDARPGACPDRTRTVSWSLSPHDLVVSGTVMTVGTDGSGATQVMVSDHQNVAHELTLRIPWPVPLEAGDPVEVTVAEFRLFAIYRTLEVRKRGSVVVYLTDVPPPALPPPVPLEVGEAACSAAPVPSGLIKYHRIVAHDGDRLIVIDVGQEVVVGGFRVLNDLTQTYPKNLETVPEGVLDVIDTMGVAMIAVQ